MHLYVYCSTLTSRSTALDSSALNLSSPFPLAPPPLPPLPPPPPPLSPPLPPPSPTARDPTVPAPTAIATPILAPLSLALMVPMAPRIASIVRGGDEERDLVRLSAGVLAALPVGGTVIGDWPLAGTCRTGDGTRCSRTRPPLLPPPKRCRSGGD